MGSSLVESAGVFLVVSLFTMVFVDLLYVPSWPITVAVGVLVGLILVLMMRNREKNLKKWEKHPTTFPNPLGGGLIGEYVKRPWMRELAELGQTYPGNRSKKKTSRNSKGDKPEQN